MDGVASSGMPVSDLLKHGDLGLGTFKHMVGQYPFRPPHPASRPFFLSLSLLLILTLEPNSKAK